MDAPKTLTEVFQQLWGDLAPLSRALLMRSVVSFFGGGETLDRPIYHYASAGVFHQIIANREIWTTNAAYLNDAGELSYPVHLAQQVLEEIGHAETDSQIKGFVDAVARDVAIHSIYKAWYVASFSLEGNLLSQWRAYCPTGGFSLGFDGLALSTFLRETKGLQFGPVIYDEASQLARIRAVVTRQLDTFRATRSELPELADESYSRDMELYLALSLGEALIFFKPSAFSEEREWRVATYDFSEGQGIANFRERNGLLTPFLKLPLSRSDEKLPLQRIFVSPLGEPELAAHAADLCLKYHGYDNPAAIIERPTYGLRF